MFRTIYGNVNSVVLRSSLGFHFFEEIGEVAREIRIQDRKRLEAELADVFAWTMAMAMKVPELQSFSSAMWEVYPGICKICRQNECICHLATD